jgi:hypothetical protein
VGKKVPFFVDDRWCACTEADDYISSHVLLRTASLYSCSLLSIVFVTELFIITFTMQSYTLGQLSLLCEELLSVYGSVIKAVGSYLLRRGSRSLYDIRIATELKEADVTI